MAPCALWGARASPVVLQPPEPLLWVHATQKELEPAPEPCHRAEHPLEAGRSRASRQGSLGAGGHRAARPGSSLCPPPPAPGRKSAFNGLFRGRGRVFLSRRNADMEDSALSFWQVPGSSGAGSRAAPAARADPSVGGGGRGVQVPDPPPVTAGRAHAAFPFIRAELCSQMAGRGGPGGVLGTMKSSWGTEPASAWLVPFPSGVRGSGGVPEPARKGESVDPSGKRTLRRWGAVGGGRASQEAAAQARGPVPPPPRPPLPCLGRRRGRGPVLCLYIS